MLKKICVYSALMFSCFFTLSVLATPPANLALEKKAVSQYVKSGAYKKDVEARITPAMQYLKERIQQNTSNQKLAVVFDIDETAVSHFKQIKSNDYGQTPAYIMHILRLQTGQAITPVLELYNYAKAHGVAVILLTGRSAALRLSTIKLLHNTGYKDWTRLVLKPTNYKNPSAISFKASVRKQLENAGYDIILNIGDQQSDLTGGYADKTVKLPNPFYFVP